MSSREDSEASSLELMRWIVREQRRAGEAAIRARDLSHEQAAVLAHLAQNPGVIQRDLMRATGTSAPSVSRLLTGLQRRDLVERRTEDGDARSHRIYATSAGAALIAGFGADMDAVDASILGSLEPGDRAALHDLLARVAASVRPPASPTSP